MYCIAQRLFLLHLSSDSMIVRLNWHRKNQLLIIPSVVVRSDHQSKRAYNLTTNVPAHTSSCAKHVAVQSPFLKHLSTSLLGVAMYNQWKWSKRPQQATLYGNTDCLSTSDLDTITLGCESKAQTGLMLIFNQTFICQMLDESAEMPIVIMLQGLKL